MQSRKLEREQTRIDSYTRTDSPRSNFLTLLAAAHRLLISTLFLPSTRSQPRPYSEATQQSALKATHHLIVLPPLFLPIYIRKVVRDG